MECMYKLQTFGLPTDHLPVKSDGSIDTESNRRFWGMRRALERMAHQKAMHVMVPSRKDVLLGVGKGIQSHIGNVRYRQLLQDCKDKYDQSAYSERKQITEEIVYIVKQASGRFLKEDEIGWVEVDDDIARVKISAAFRAMRSHRWKDKYDQTSDRKSTNRSKREGPENCVDAKKTKLDFTGM